MWSLLAFKCHTIYTAEEQQESCCALNFMHKTHKPIVTNVDFEKFDNLTVYYLYEILQFMKRLLRLQIAQISEIKRYSITIFIFINHLTAMNIAYSITSDFITFFHFSYLWKNRCEVLEWAIFGSFIVIFHYWYQKDLTSITDSFFVCTIQSITKQRFSIIAGDCTFSKKGTHISILLEIQDHLI